MRPARCPVRPVKKPSKLPEAPDQHEGVQLMTSGEGFETPGIGVPENAPKYWSR